MGKRFFAFGCSFTAYSWPSWADLLALGYEEYHNYGIAGIGNRAIVERLAEANATYNFTKDDLVVVQWSTHLRNDWYNPRLVKKEGGVAWKTDGSVFNYKNLKRYSQDWYDTFFYEPAYIMHTFNFISLGQQLLENTGCEWYMTSIGDLRNIGTDLKDSNTFNENVIPRDVKNEDFTCWEVYPHFKDVYNKTIWEDRKEHWLDPIMVTANWNFPQYTYQWLEDGKLEDELHPSVEQHAFWLDTHLLEKLDKKELRNQIEPICLHTRDMYNMSINNMKSFETRMFMSPILRDITKNKWPNLPQGILE
jgi:hypothetical protein